MPIPGAVSSSSQSSSSDRFQYLNHNSNANHPFPTVVPQQNAILLSQPITTPSTQQIALPSQQSNTAFKVWHMPNMTFEQYKNEKLYHEYLQSKI